MKIKWKISKIIFALFTFMLFFSFLSTIYAHDFSWGKIDLQSTTKYRYQWSDTPDKDLLADDTNDQDIYEILSLDAVQSNSGVNFSMLGKYAKDLDGTSDGSIFQDYIDTGTNRQKLDVYYAYLEKEFNNVSVRLGRQYAYSSEIVNFDGAWIRGDNVGGKWFNFEVFGGRIVQTYSNLDKDFIGGVNLEIDPFKNLSFYIDSVFYQENSYEVGTYWKPTDNIKVRGNFAFINDSSRSWSLDVMGTCPVTKTTLSLNIYKRYTVPVDDDFLFDYTSTIDSNIGDDIKRFYLARELGYVDYTLTLTQPIPNQEGINVFVGFTKRDMSDNGDGIYEKLYNTDFYRVTFGFNIDNWDKLKGTNLSFGYSYWKEQRSSYYEGSSKSFYADLEQEIGEKLEAGAGFYYKTEDVNGLVEGEASHNYYANLKYKFSKEKYAELKYEYETDDYYHEFGISGVNALTASIHLTW